jgi:DNA-binding response OmpR family regulator
MIERPQSAVTKVLVVEDDPSQVEVVRSYLAAERYQATVAYDGPGGLEAARREEPDLVLLDVMLPGLDGVEVRRRRSQLRGVRAGAPVARVANRLVMASWTPPSIRWMPARPSALS